MGENLITTSTHTHTHTHTLKIAAKIVLELSNIILVAICKITFFSKSQNYSWCVQNIKNNYLNWITMTRKSAEHLRTIYWNTGLLFRPYLVSSAGYTVISTIGDRTCDHRLQCRNSTTEPPIHIAHKWRQMMRPNKVETADQCSRISCVGVRRIFWSW